jgi:hypothetical protein
MTSRPSRPEADVVEARRKFLAACGRFSIATPPAVALMLAAAERNYAVAASGGGGGGGNSARGPQGNNGFGNGGGDGVPGNSNKSDVNR